MVKRILHAPIVHFLVIGAAIFLLFYTQRTETSDAPDRITISKPDIDRLASAWEKNWLRPPTPEELQGIIEATVREEILYREALAMGLDKGDTIVRRRLAQKMKFLFSDLTSLAEPSEDELRGFLERNRDRYQVPGTITFLQVYLNPETRRSSLTEDIKDILSDLRSADTDIDPARFGDRLMYQFDSTNLRSFEVARIFGKQFTQELFAQPSGQWVGPIRSGYGVHLVRIYDKTDDRDARFEEVSDAVHRDLMTEKREQLDNDFYLELRKRYEVEIESFDKQTKSVVSSD